METKEIFKSGAYHNFEFSYKGEQYKIEKYKSLYPRLYIYSVEFMRYDCLATLDNIGENSVTFRFNNMGCITFVELNYNELKQVIDF